MSKLMTVTAIIVLVALALLNMVEGLTAIDGLRPLSTEAFVVRWLTVGLTLFTALGLLVSLLRHRPHGQFESATTKPRYGLPVQPGAQAPGRAPAPARTPVAPRAAQSPNTTAPSRASGGLESVMVDGKLTPAAYFMFASDPLSVASIRKAKQEYGRVLIGFDAGSIPENGDIESEAFGVAKDLGVELEIYVEGPGGKTGDSWNPGEVARVKAAAKSLGIDVSRGGWMAREWDKWGWKKYTFQQLANYRRIGFNAGEIDNLDRIYEPDKDTDGLIEFFREYGELQKAGELPQLVLKNISVTDMTAVVAAINAGQLTRTAFADFHIFECKNTDKWKPVDDISKEVGIRTVPSRDTHHYSAKGRFELDEEFDRAVQREQGIRPSDGTTPVA